MGIQFQSLHTTEAPWLERKEVNLFYRRLASTDVANQAAFYYSLLSLDEKNKAEHFSAENLRNQFIFSRGFLRQLISNYLGISNERIAFRSSRYGKPILAGALESKLFFNVSHSKDFLVVGLSETSDLGVDVEYLDPFVDALSLIERVGTQVEQDTFSRLKGNIEQQMLYFYRLWTVKEAFLKWVGCGLLIEPKNVIYDPYSNSVRIDGVTAFIEDARVDHLFYNNEYSMAVVSAKNQLPFRQSKTASV